MKITQRLTARTGEKVTEAAKLKDRRYRKEKAAFAFEGKKLFLEALQRRVPLTAVFCTQNQTDFCLGELERTGNTSVPLYEVTDSVYEKLSEEKSPEGIFCAAKSLDKLHKFATIYICENSAEKNPPTRAILSQLRDPGNLGTVIRSAAAFGIDELILSADCADLYNRKTVRATMGTLFSMKITLVEDLPASIEALRRSGCTVLGAALNRDAETLWKRSPKELASGRVVYAVGNEGHGLSEAVLSACDGSVFIPMTENAESLNAAAAASILFYELYRAKHQPFTP